ncbi:hypothetical protein [Nocardia sp. NPDC052566]|uniref:hypothetical protein n=1 Tax=Nocardia sp. NPDC052566 TaxID=3364330 RepID=UPI0037CB51BF
MTVPETGQTKARELYAAATATDGDEPFRLSEDVADKLATACDKLVDDLQKARRTGHLATEVRGFPDLPTGNDLAAGFAGKGRQLLDTVTAFQQTALLYKAAYLAAGRRFADAEAANKAAFDLIANTQWPTPR